MRLKIVTYQFFVVEPSGRILSGWDYRSDAQDALEDLPAGHKFISIKRVNKDALSAFLTNNNYKLKAA